MSKEEAKQWLRSQIDSCIKSQDEIFKDTFYLRYNKNYLRALKLSTITGQPVNKDGFIGSEGIFGFNIKTKRFWLYSEIFYYLEENLSKDSVDIYELLKEVLCEYEEYKDYNSW